MQEGIKKLEELVEGVRSDQFTSEEYMRYYTIVYEICKPCPGGPECQKLYDEYKKIFEDYIPAKVLPFLREKKDENLLEELVTRWNKYKVLTRWLVYGELNNQVRDIVISMIGREREGEQINQALVKNVLDIYVEIGEGSTKYYATDFEEAMLNDATSFYSKKASIWIVSLSYKDYMLKVEECINQEKDRVSSYLQSRSRHKLLEVVEHDLCDVYATKLVEKKQLDWEAASMNE